MLKKLLPFAHAKSIYDVDVYFYSQIGIRVIFTDLDNTLDRYDTKLPSQRTIDYFNKIKQLGIQVYIISNNHELRVHDYAEMLGVNYMTLAGKPFSSKINRFIKEHNLCKDEIIFIGDQLLTDCVAAKGAGLKCMITEPLYKKDQWTTVINRRFDKLIRYYYNKHGMLVDWRTIYVNSTKS